MISLNEESQTIWQAQGLERLRYEYDLKPSDVVIDIGAYRGEWASQIYCRYHCQLIVIEPGPWIRGFPIGEIINKAAGDHDGVLKFGGNYYYSSAHEEPNTEYECFDIKPLVEKYEEIALIKINIEGDEYLLLKRIIDLGLHKRVKNFQIQFHEIEGEPWDLWYQDIEHELIKTHELTFRYNFCWENWRRV